MTSPYKQVCVGEKHSGGIFMHFNKKWLCVRERLVLSINLEFPLECFDRRFPLQRDDVEFPQTEFCAKETL